MPPDNIEYEYRWFRNGEPAGPGCFVDPVSPPEGYDLHRRPVRGSCEGWTAVSEQARG